MRIASLVVVKWVNGFILLTLLISNQQYEALSHCAKTAQTSHGFQIELDAKKFKAGNPNEVDAIGQVLSKFPQDRVSVQVYSNSEPIKEAEAIRDRLLERNVSSQQISLSGLSQNETQPMSMWLEIQPTS